MLRKYTHIALVLLLGLYYNSVPIAWLSYSTFAEKIFAEHCINPTKPSCHGMCQVVSLENKNAKRDQPHAPTLQTTQIQPTILPSVKIPDIPQVRKGIAYIFDAPSIRMGILQAPFHPPRILS